MALGPRKIALSVVYLHIFNLYPLDHFCCDFLQIWTRFHAHCVDSGPLFTKEMRQVVVACNEMKRIGG